MSEVLEYIDSYFNGQLTGDERVAFERKCVEDSSFARDVAFYVSTRAATRDQLIEFKQKEWNRTPVVPLKTTINPVRRLSKWASVAVAASVLVAVAVIYYVSNPGVSRLAKNYIEVYNQKLQSQTMGDGADSIAIGKDAYNKKDYKKAEQVFTAVARYHPENAEAKEYAGLVYFANGNYDKAINYFGALANMKGLHSNPGLFLKAITMIMRNAPGDLEKAKGMLEDVVKNDLDGKEEAEKILAKLK
jgi:tetratricopeptide (TPR) repeat protein